MLDYLYTTQYQMRGIVAVSLGEFLVLLLSIITMERSELAVKFYFPVNSAGRACDQNNERYTHGVYMRFQSKEDLEKFYVNPFYLRVLNEHVMPYCHVCLNM